MAPKSKATASKKAPTSVKPASKGKAKAAPKSSLAAIADTVGETLDKAGELLLDNDASSGSKTPVGVTDALEGAGVPVKKGKKAAGDAVKKGSKAAAQAEEAAKEVAQPNSKKRKQAEDFFSTTGEQVLGAVHDLADKVGHAVEGVVEGFAEASGLSHAGVKEPVKKRAKQVAARAEETVDGATKKGKKVAGEVEEAVEGQAKVAVKKGKKIAAQAEEAVESGKKAASKKGKQVAEVVVEAEKKGKKAAKEAEPVVAKATRSARSTAAATEPVIAQGKRAAATVATEAVKQGKKAGKIAKAAVDAAAEAANEDVEMDGEELHGFSSSDGEGADSSDDESDDEDEAVRAAGKKIDMKSLPMVAKDDKSVAARLKKAHKKKDTQKGTLYLGRIPHGFYEEQMKEYFSQFGDVSRLRLARNRKTGASKHYAYIEMSSQPVAEIVAETMNNYLLKGHLLKCHVIPADEVHPELWVGANKKFRVIPKARLEKAKHDKQRTQEQQDKANTNLLDKQDKRKQRIKDKGIDYDFDGHA